MDLYQDGYGRVSEEIRRHAACLKDSAAHLMFLRSFQTGLSWRAVCKIMFTSDRMFGRPCADGYPYVVLPTSPAPVHGYF